MVNAIILAGGQGLRIRGETEIPKPLLPLGKETILSKQARWFLSKGFEKIFIVASPEVADGDTKLETENQVQIIVEKERQGTAGAMKLGMENAGEIYYLCNVDDLVQDSIPMKLVEKAEKFGAAILAGKPRLQFGRIYSRGDLVLNFKEKPGLDFWVSCGHYAFNLNKMNGIEIPSQGSLEETVLPKLSKARKLAIEKYRGKWITISNYKDYMELLKAVET